MRVGLLLLLALIGILSITSTLAHIEPDDSEADDFAEFDFDEDNENENGAAPNAQAHPKAAVEEDDFDDEDDEFENEPVAPKKANVVEDFDDDVEDAIVEDVDSEFNHLLDEEEFEGFNNEEEEEDEFEHMSTKGRGAKEKPKPKTGSQGPQTLKIPTNIPMLYTKWENYYLEMLMIAGIVVYFLNFFTGKTKNQKIATAWFNSHKPILESNFSLIGDDGAKSIEDVETPLQKESEHLFTLWCSGRVCCEGMLVELKLLKRQDIVAVISNMMKPACDQVKVKVNMSPEDMDSYVFCLAQKKTALKVSKEMSDIMTFCPEKRPAQEKYGLPSNSSYFIMSEIPEVTSAMLTDSKLMAMLSKYPDAIDSIHFSDQYTGVKPPEDQTPAELPEGKKVLIFTFNITGIRDKQSIDESAEAMKPLMLLVLYFIDKVKRFRLSREAKNKAEKNRSKVAELFWKSIHAARAERAQEERERKRRELKEKISEMEDPDKQRKMEERVKRREQKKGGPKMKQLKLRSC